MQTVEYMKTLKLFRMITVESASEEIKLIRVDCDELAEKINSATRAKTS